MRLRPIRSRPGLLVSLTLAAALTLLTACTQPGTERDGERDRSKDLARYYGQDLSFGSCEGFASTADERKAFVDPLQCARLTVPLDYDDPEGETAQIAVLRAPATGDRGQRIGSLLVNPGGPGGPGLAQAVVTSVTLARTPITEHFDVVGFDPRGVGATRPSIRCFTDAERDRGQDQTTLLASSGSWNARDTRALIDQCADRSGGKKVLSSVGTRDTARDMDVLRAALGDEKLSYLGRSYGTRLGAAYAEMFPHKVRAMVFDGAVDPGQDSATRRLSQQEGFQRSFDQMAAACARQVDCPLGQDAARATSRFQQLVRPLIDDPVPAGSGRTLDFNRATAGVTAGLYQSAQWPAIIAGIRQLADGGRGDRLLALSDTFAGRSPEGRWSNFLDANFAINCNDENRRTPARESELRRQISSTSPFIDTGRTVRGTTRDACEAWPTKPTLGTPYAQDVQGLPPTLTVSITGDPSTPYAAGKELARSLGGVMVTVEGEQHTVVMDGTSPCVTGVVSAYLVGQRIPDQTARCRL